MKVDHFKLQALRIPAGWSVEFNNFVDINPLDEEIILTGKYVKDRNGWNLFDQSLLFLFHRRAKLKLDVGWVPSYSPAGRFVVQLVGEDGWSQPLYSYESKDKNEVVKAIEELLVRVNSGDFKGSATPHLKAR